MDEINRTEGNADNQNIYTLDDIQNRDETIKKNHSLSWKFGRGLMRVGESELRKRKTYV